MWRRTRYASRSVQLYPHGSIQFRPTFCTDDAPPWGRIVRADTLPNSRERPHRKALTWITMAALVRGQDDPAAAALQDSDPAAAATALLDACTSLGLSEAQRREFEEVGEEQCGEPERQRETRAALLALSAHLHVTRNCLLIHTRVVSWHCLLIYTRAAFLALSGRQHVPRHRLLVNTCCHAPRHRLLVNTCRHAPWHCSPVPMWAVARHCAGHGTS